MYFVAMALTLRHARCDVPLSAADGPHAHAAVMRAISDIDPDAGRTLHDMRVRKPITIAIVGGDACGAILRLTFMARDGLTYANILAGALAARPSLRLGDVACAVESVDLAHPMWSGVGTWADILSGDPARRIRFTFATPTAIMKRDGNGDRFTALYPDPSDLFLGLARRWRSLDGPPLLEDLEGFVRSGGCVVSGHNLRTETFHAADHTQIGFVGWVTYE
ncbi:MAG: CRISPR system precrRNA processing endoribonuclease RAMP protein Cas6, partial [Chloroflexota bacterium]|nr:CRISPR system precrRNA processing endoribonuclease RAMP protein Cas6 [Chloroflexota bacterium]